MDQENNRHTLLMQEAVELAIRGMQQNEGGPFGALVVKDGKIIGRGNNKVISTNDPTAHAEVLAIREACKNLNSFQLDGCIIYTSCEPCPMCLGAIYWARLDRIYYACNKKDAASIGFDDAFIYKELPLSLSDRKIKGFEMNRSEGLKAFEMWRIKEDKTRY